MPKRRRTRAADRAQRIEDERKLNAAYFSQFTQPAAAEVEQQNKPPPADECEFWEVATNTNTDDDPPPF
jgi:hypothetical protein